jgi:hypothetical protein
VSFFTVGLVNRTFVQVNIDDDPETELQILVVAWSPSPPTTIIL